MRAEREDVARGGATAVEDKEPSGLDGDGNRRPYGEIRREQHAIVRQELVDRFGADNRIDYDEDPIRWRRAIRKNPLTAMVWRVGVFVVGLAIILVGIPMVPLTGPGWVVIFIGLFLWSTEFMWARRITQFVKAEVKTFDLWARVLPWKAKVPMVMLSIAFGWLCAWAALAVTGVPAFLPDVIENPLKQLPLLGD